MLDLPTTMCPLGAQERVFIHLDRFLFSTVTWNTHQMFVKVLHDGVKHWESMQWELMHNIVSLLPAAPSSSKCQPGETRRRTELSVRNIIAVVYTWRTVDWEKSWHAVFWVGWSGVTWCALRSQSAAWIVSVLEHTLPAENICHLKSATSFTPSSFFQWIYWLESFIWRWNPETYINWQRHYIRSIHRASKLYATSELYSDHPVANRNRRPRIARINVIFIDRASAAVKSYLENIAPAGICVLF